MNLLDTGFMDNPDLKNPTLYSSHPRAQSLPESFRYALSGVARTLLTQRNMKLHVLSALTVLLFGLVFSFSPTAKALVLLCIGLVLCAELLNTSMEAIVDLYTGETHRLAKVAKDAAAGGVLVLSMVALLIFLIVLSFHWQEIERVEMVWTKVSLIVVIVLLEGLSLFVLPATFWPLFVQGVALFFMVFISVVSNEPIFSFAAFLLMALISFAPVLVKKDETE